MMTGEEIKEKVIVKLEEFSPYAPDAAGVGPLLTGADALDEIKPIYSYVNETLPQAANEILLVAPLDKLESVAYNGATVIPDTAMRTGSITLPATYLRLHSLRMNSWTRTLHEAAKFGSPVALAQDNEWTMGTPHKPVVVQGEGRLYYYSIAKKKPHTILEFRYIPVFDLEGEYVEYDDNIAELIALNCAKKVYEIFQNAEGVNMMASEIKSAMEALAL